MDIKPTFLRGELDEKNCMAQLEGFKIVGGEDKACLLKNFLYGCSYQDAIQRVLCVYA